jgi:hypothetical protein
LRRREPVRAPRGPLGPGPDRRLTPRLAPIAHSRRDFLLGFLNHRYNQALSDRVRCNAKSQGRKSCFPSGTTDGDRESSSRC